MLGNGLPVFRGSDCMVLLLATHHLPCRFMIMVYSYGLMVMINMQGSIPGKEDPLQIWVTPTNRLAAWRHKKGKWFMIMNLDPSAATF